MILWFDPGHDVEENMRRDAVLLARAEREGASFAAVLRLFTFVPAGITLGASQDPARELDLDRCIRDGVRWAVRPTGGRSIYHDEEWTYSLAAWRGDPRWGGSLREAYARVSSVIVASLRELGVPARLANVARSTDRAAPRARTAHAAPCFASTARHEVVLGERKLVGSAQRRTASALLQQGSVLLGPAHLRLTSYLQAGERSRQAARAELERGATYASGFERDDLGIWAGALLGILGNDVVQVEGDAGCSLLRDTGREWRAGTRAAVPDPVAR